MADLTNLIAAGPPAYSLNLQGLFDAWRKGKDAEYTDRTRDAFKDDIPRLADGSTDYAKAFERILQRGGVQAAQPFIAGQSLDLQRQQMRNDAAGSQFLYGGGGGAQAPVQGGAPGSYEDNLARAESNNNPNAQNKKSSAGGLFQFLDGTWEDLQKRYPQLGLTDKFNPDQQKKAERVFRFENARSLKTGGQEVNEQNLSLSHFLGAGGANRFLSQYATSPDSPAAAFVDPKAVEKNQHLFFRGGNPISARDFYSGFNSGGGGVQVAQSGARGFGGVAPTQSRGAPPTGQDPEVQNRINMLGKIAGSTAFSEAMRKQAAAERDFLMRNNELTPGQKEHADYRRAGGTLSPDERELKKQEDKAKIERDTAYHGPVEKGYGETFTKIQDEGRAAGRSVAILGLMERIAKDPRFYSGTGGELVTTAKRALVSLGIREADAAAPNELFQKLANQNVLESNSHGLGQGISSTDRDYMARAGANVENTKEGNLQVIDVTRKMAKRKQDVAAFTRNYADKNKGKIDAGFDRALAAWAEKNPMFPVEEKKWEVVDGVKIRARD